MKIIVGIVLAAVVIGGGVLFFVSGNDTDIETNTSEQELEEEGESGIGSIAALLSKGKDIECTFRNEQNGNVTLGTTYIAGDERMRGQFTLMQGNGETLETSMIRDGEYAYTWGGPFGEGQGSKIKLSTVEGLGSIETIEDENNSDGFLDDQETTYECFPWDIDVSLFIPPAEITFQDISAGIMEMREATEDLDMLQCEACNQITDPGQKEQCLQALGCT